jgi:hypothetical protein
LDTLACFHRELALDPTITTPDIIIGFAAVDFQSADPSIIKSIKQRDLLNTWLRLYSRRQQLPRLEEYQPSRIADEIGDLVHYTVDTVHQPPRLVIQSDGTRMSDTYGSTGKGRDLDEYLGPRMAAIMMPVYYKCLDHARPVYTIFMIDDVHGRSVAYERLLMPFSDQGDINHIIASLKTISEDGGFEIKNLFRANDALPTAKLCAIIDRNLFHRMPGRGVGGDVIEFNLRSHLPRRQTRPAAPLSGTTARRGYATSFA